MRGSSLKQIARVSCLLFRSTKLRSVTTPSSRCCSSSSSSNGGVISSVDVSKVLADDKQHVITMPSIMDSKSGVVNKWLIEEGDSFGPDDTLCEASIDDMIIGIDCGHGGILAKIVCQKGRNVDVGEPLAIYVDDRDSYFAYFADQKQSVEDFDHMKEVEDNEIVADAKTILREIRHMIDDGDIDGESEFCKHLRSLGRKGDSELVAVFEASNEGKHFNSLTFDRKFFLDGASAIIEERKDELGNKGGDADPNS